MTVEIINKILEGQHDKPILVDVLYQDNAIKKPIVIFAHGYKGYKDWGAWNLVAQRFAENNIVFVKFNFSHNGGTVEQPIDFPDLEAFGQNNFTKELDDLQTVIDWVYKNDVFADNFDFNNLSLIGHSRGGGIVLIKAFEELKIKKVITWAGVSDYGVRFPSGAVLETWRKNGVLFIENSRTLQKMPHYFQFYQNFIENKDRLNIHDAVTNLKIPQLIIHGEADETVRLVEAEQMHQWNPKSKLCVIDKANHTFGSSQPWVEDTLPEALEQVAKKTIEFINKAK
jgi:pimeloyl-ACP methyl ester carboxylesterase